MGSWKYLQPDPALLPRVGTVSEEMQPVFLPSPAVMLPGAVRELQAYAYAYNNPQSETDETGEGILGCIVCTY